MNVALRTPWTQDAFFAWAAQREGRFEFDGYGPVEVTGGSFNHNQLLHNLHDALRTRLRNSTAYIAGPDMAIQTVGSAIRLPDALISFTKPAGRALLMPDPIIVFEILSPTTERTDRSIKVREYAAVPTIRRYVIIDYNQIEVKVFARAAGTAPWLEENLSGMLDELDLPEIGARIALGELYNRIDFDTAPGGER